MVLRCRYIPGAKATVVHWDMVMKLTRLLQNFCTALKATLQCRFALFSYFVICDGGSESNTLIFLISQFIYFVKS